MALVTVKRMRAIYTMLLAFPPFDRWDMPPADQVRFFVLRDLRAMGVYNSGDKHHIGIHPDTHWTLHTFVATMAHEMAHMRQEIIGKRPATKDEQHNRAFYAIARQICTKLGLDPERF